MNDGLHIRQLAFWYRTDDAPIVYDSTFSVPPGFFVAIVGESGSGKSTLLRLSAGLLQAQLADQPSDTAKLAGSVHYDGRSVLRPQPEFAFVPQNFQAGFLPALSARDNILLAVKEDGISKEEAEEAEMLIRETGIVDAALLNIKQLSGGQQQRVAICRALVTKPRLLFMDEPFANLDPTLKPTMGELLSRLRKRYGLSVLMVTHDIEGAVKIADSTVGVKPGYARPIYEVFPKNVTPDVVETWMLKVADGRN